MKMRAFSDRYHVTKGTLLDLTVQSQWGFNTPLLPECGEPRSKGKSGKKHQSQSLYSSEAPSVATEPLSLWLPSIHSSPGHTGCSPAYAMSWTARELHFTLRETVTLILLKLFQTTEKEGPPKFVLKSSLTPKQNSNWGKLQNMPDNIDTILHNKYYHT